MTAEAWACGEVGTILDRVRDENRMVAVSELQEEVGIGHDDLRDVLSALRERGEAVEGAPGEWRRPFDDELQDARPAAPAAASSADGEHGEEDSPPAPGRAARPAARVTSEDGECVLTVGVAQALGADSLGKLVEAGIAEAAAAGRPFVLRVS